MRAPFFLVPMLSMADDDDEMLSRQRAIANLPS